MCTCMQGNRRCHAGLYADHKGPCFWGNVEPVSIISRLLTTCVVMCLHLAYMQTCYCTHASGLEVLNGLVKPDCHQNFTFVVHDMHLMLCPTRSDVLRLLPQLVHAKAIACSRRKIEARSSCSAQTPPCVYTPLLYLCMVVPLYNTLNMCCIFSGPTQQWCTKRWCWQEYGHY